MNFSEIKDYESLSEFLDKTSWQNFEKLTGFVFEENNFKAQVNKVKMLDKRKRRQYDVLAENFSKLFVVDCKFWGKGRYKSSALRDAIETHIERCKYIETKKELVPLIVTSNNEDIQEHNEVFIVPIDKLNRFLQEL